MKKAAGHADRTIRIRTFLIADIRGYTRFTRERGDAEAARLATKFAHVARDSVEARGGRVIELRGDEALAVFASSIQAVRAALEFQATCLEETAGEPDLPLTVGIGIDVGEAIPVEEGFRGVALNTAARLCSRAAAGQVLVTRGVAELAGDVDDAGFEERGSAELKGFEEPVDLIEVVSLRSAERVEAHASERGATTADRAAPLPAELDTFTPLVGRHHEMHWLRGTWRQARRGRGRVVVVSGPSQIGKTRLAAELAYEGRDGGGRVVYAGPGGAATALAVAAVREAAEAMAPSVVILDDLDVAGEDAARSLAAAQTALASRPVFVIALVKDPEANPSLVEIVAEADRSGDGHVRLPALDLGGVEGIARLYVGEDVEDIPLGSMARASHGVPGRVHEVVSEWARDEAGRRLAAAAEWLAEGRGRRSADLEFANNVIGLKLGRLYRGEGEAPAADSGCPYKGLASFEEDDAASFFGRERLVGELAARTVQVGLLGVLGASGSGKSSVVAAGLLPSLDAGLLPGSDRWRHVVFRPGEHPQEALTAALAAIAPPSGGGDPVEATIEAVGSDGRLVVAIDQFEEVFTLCADEREREAFIGAITRTVSRSPERIVFVLTIRDDFYGRCAPYRDLAELLVANHVLVPPMTSDELRRAIELPARRTRLRVEAALADALVAEAEGEPGALPLLSAALVELWQARDDGWLRVGTYERTGGLRGAVARLAEASYRQLSDGERDMARRICLRLAGIGDGEVVTRRRVELSEFDVDTNPVAADVLARLTRDRLLTITDSTVEVAHEALLREWPRLRGWLEEDLQGHQLRQHLTQAAKQWEGRRRDTSEMYRGARLSAALDWASTRGPDLNELERDFLAASREASEREAERQRRTNRRLRGLLVGTALFLVVALVAGALALVQRGRARGETERAEKQAQIASARELAAASVANLEVDPERSILLALEAVDATWEADRTVEPEAEEALHRALIESRVVLTVPQGGGLAVSPDGERFATTGEDGTTTVRDAATGRALMTLEAHRGAVTDVEFSPDGDLLATTGGDGAVRLWDSEHGRQLQALRAGGEPVLNTAFSPDGNRLATLEAGVLRLWDVPAGTQRVLARAPAGGTFDVFVPPGPPAFSPDGSLVASATWDGSAKIWDVATGKTKLVVTNPVWFITDVALSPDGRYLLSGSPDGTARMWSASSGDLVSTFSGHTGEVRAIGFSPDGSRIATGSSEGIARVWDAATGELLMSLAGHTDTIDSLAFTPDGRELLTAAIDGTTRLWDVSLAGGRDWLTVPGPSLRLGGFAFSPGGRTFAVPGDISGVTIRDVQTGRRIVTLRGSNAKVTQVAFSPDGRRLAVAAGSGLPPPRKADTTVPIWDVETGEMLMVLRGHDDVVNGVAFSPDGSRLATASYDETVRVWDTTSGEMLEKLDMEGGGWAVAFSPDGRSLLGTDEQLEEPAVVVWDVDTFRQIGRFTGHSDVVQDIGFGPGGRVVTAGWDGQAMIWDLDSRRELLTLRGRGGAVLDAVFSPDGTRVATGTFDGTATIWDAGTGRKLFTLFGHERLVHTVAFSPDGRFLATASGDGTVTLYLLAIDELRALAGRRVTRLLTDDECLQYLHVASCPQGS